MSGTPLIKVLLLSRNFELNDFFRIRGAVGFEYVEAFVRNLYRKPVVHETTKPILYKETF